MVWNDPAPARRAVSTALQIHEKFRRNVKGGEQADVPFALNLTLSNLGEGSNTV
jgi:hypothetical protein